MGENEKQQLAIIGESSRVIITEEGRSKLDRDTIMCTIGKDWKPTQENIEWLPDPIKKYIKCLQDSIQDKLEERVRDSHQNDINNQLSKFQSNQKLINSEQARINNNTYKLLNELKDKLNSETIRLEEKIKYLIDNIRSKTKDF